MLASFSVSPFDIWGPVSIGWSFDDNASAGGTSVSHAYAAPGSYQVSVTATDAAGNTISASRTITIAPSPVAAAVSALRLRPATFRAARSGPSVKAAAVRTGTRVGYSLNVAARVHFTVERALRGRRVGARCVKPTHANRKHKRCTHYVRLRGSFTRTRPAAPDRFTFTGWLAGHALKPGSYRLVCTPAANGNTGKPTRATFRIVK